jgi:hypothetical protein
MSAFIRSFSYFEELDVSLRGRAYSGSQQMGLVMVWRGFSPEGINRELHPVDFVISHSKLPQ